MGQVVENHRCVQNAKRIEGWADMKRDLVDHDIKDEEREPFLITIGKHRNIRLPAEKLGR